MSIYVHSENIIVDNLDVEKPDLNIAFTFDEAYIRASGVLLFSILENNTMNLHVHIFTTVKDLSLFDKFLNFKSKITIYSLNEEYFLSLQTPGHFSSAIYYRIAIPNILQGRLKNILYLDADILCVGDISFFKNLDIGDNYIAAVEDTGHTKIKSMLLNENKGSYFNSGVMYINIDKWIDNKIFDKFMLLINERDYDCPDQDVLNIMFWGEVYFILEKYNHFTEIKSDHAILIHYIGMIKPWSLVSELNHKYIEYYNQSPFMNIPLDQPKSYKLAKKYAKKLWRYKNYLLSVKWWFLYIFMKFK